MVDLMSDAAQFDNYQQYYDAKLEGAKNFQDFVVDAAWDHLGLAIVQYSSKAYQNKVGESRTGVEIKFDEKFAKTGNLWIEISEKSKPRPGPYHPSGIYRTDNTWLYSIGNYDVIFIFAKKFLCGLHKSGRWRTMENNSKTSEGFLLPKQEALKYAAAIIYPKNKVN
tara:strand:- start:2763 stop:3263 length:501 start_codon:yes stop_codon:yes gene_type:complete